MQDKPQMNSRQIVVVSFIVGVTVFLTYAAFFFIGADMAEGAGRPILEIAGAAGILAMLGSLCVCFISLWDRR
jgi:hypothetical protein